MALNSDPTARSSISSCDDGLSVRLSVCVTPPLPLALSPQTVVELFYQTTARKIIISQIYSQQQGALILHWSHMMSSVVHLLTQLLYPSSGLSCCALCF